MAKNRRKTQRAAKSSPDASQEQDDSITVITSVNLDGCNIANFTGALSLRLKSDRDPELKDKYWVVNKCWKAFMRVMNHFGGQTLIIKTDDDKYVVIERYMATKRCISCKWLVKTGTSKGRLRYLDGQKCFEDHEMGVEWEKLESENGCCITDKIYGELAIRVQKTRDNMWVIVKVDDVQPLKKIWLYYNAEEMTSPLPVECVILDYEDDVDGDDCTQHFIAPVDSSVTYEICDCRSVYRGRMFAFITIHTKDDTSGMTRAEVEFSDKRPNSQ